MTDVNQNVCTGVTEFKKILTKQRYPEAIEDIMKSIQELLTFKGTIIPIDGVISSSLLFFFAFNFIPTLSFGEVLFLTGIPSIIHGITHTMQCNEDLGLGRDLNGTNTDANEKEIDGLYTLLNKNIPVGVDGAFMSLAVFLISMFLLGQNAEISTILSSVTYVSHFITHTESCQFYGRSQVLQNKVADMSTTEKATCLADTLLDETAQDEHETSIVE
jgi:hypothetical protein